MPPFLFRSKGSDPGDTLFFRMDSWELFLYDSVTFQDTPMTDLLTRKLKQETSERSGGRSSP